MSSIKPVVQSALARLASFVPAALATLATSRLVLEHYGIAAFDAFALTLSLILLIPLQDLGMGAAITSSFAERGARDPHSVRTVLTATRVLLLSSLGLAAAAALLAAFGEWPRLLGPASGSNLLVGIAVCVYAASFLPGLGQSMALGIERNHVIVLIQILWNPLMLVGAAMLVLTNTDGRWLVLVPAVAVLAVNLVTCSYAIRAAQFPWQRVLRALPRRRDFPGARIWSISGPMLMLTLCVPIMLQADRIVLSHVTPKAAVANYTVALQIFAPVSALLAAATRPLWPMWIKARARGERGPALGRVVAIFCLGTAAVCIVLALISDPLGHLIGGHAINLGFALPAAAALAITIQGAAMPVAMALRDAKGIRFIGLCTVLALPVNIGLSIVFAQRWGAPGPLLATAVTGVLIQTLPGLYYAYRREAAGVPVTAAPEPQGGRHRLVRDI
jgi:O-antigen/teichoic acid export membrane protein